MRHKSHLTSCWRGVLMTSIHLTNKHQGIIHIYRCKTNGTRRTKPNLPVHDATDTDPSSSYQQVVSRKVQTHSHTAQTTTVPRRRVRLCQAAGSPVGQAALPVARHGGGQARRAADQRVNLFAPGHVELKREGCQAWAPPLPSRALKTSRGSGLSWSVQRGVPPSDTHTHTHSHTHPIPCPRDTS